MYLLLIVQDLSSSWLYNDSKNKVQSATVLPGVLLRHGCLLSRIAVRTDAEDVREEGTEEDICIEMGGVTGDWRK